MPRWLAVALGCVTALGMQALFEAVAPRLGLSGAPAAYGALFLALVLAGYVAGHLAGRWQVLTGALAAIVYIFATATLTTAREISIARQLGPGSLGPIDFGQLALRDVLALTGASCGGWLATAESETKGPASRR